MITLNEAVQQLEKSESGQMTCKLIHDFLKSPTVKFLDGPNQNAVAVVVANYMLGNSAIAIDVMEQLAAVIERHNWVEAK